MQPGSTTEFCTQCGSPIAFDAMFCERCGTRRASAQAEDATVLSTPPVPVSYSQEPEHTAVLPPVPVAPEAAFAPPGGYAPGPAYGQPAPYGQPSPYGQPGQYPGAMPQRSSNAPIILAVAVVILLIAGGVVWIVLANQSSSSNNNSHPAAVVAPSPQPPQPTYSYSPPPSDNYSSSTSTDGWSNMIQQPLPSSSGANSFCRDDGTGFAVSDDAVSDYNETDSGTECQFADALQSQYENEANNGTDPSNGLTLQVQDATGSYVSMQCYGSGPVTCDGADSGSSDSGNTFTVYLAYTTGGTTDNNGD